MKTLSYMVTLATIAATILLVSGATAINQQGNNGNGKQSPGKARQRARTGDRKQVKVKH